MGKLILRVEDLSVESFQTREPIMGKGTVRGHETWRESCPYCNTRHDDTCLTGYTCQHSCECPTYAATCDVFVNTCGETCTPDLCIDPT